MNHTQILERILELHNKGNTHNLHAFLDTLKLTKYDSKRHNNDEQMKDDINCIVDKYLIDNAKEIDEYKITDNIIQKRKDRVYNYIKHARDNMHHAKNNCCNHYIGGACEINDELHHFYKYVYDEYYELVGCSWENRF